MRILAPLLLCILSICSASAALADSGGDDRNTDPDNFAFGDSDVSPKRGWADPPKADEPEEEASTLRQIALWIPNRLLDLIDVFRIDLGVGPAAGGVVRITPYGQAGIRTMAPTSIRIGDFGRDVPFKIEHSNEFGVGPAFVQSKDREVCPGEVGLGLDLFLVGGYGGVCFDELADFVAGIFTYDIKDDDLH